MNVQQEKFNKCTLQLIFETGLIMDLKRFISSVAKIIKKIRNRCRIGLSGIENKLQHCNVDGVFLW